MNGKLKELSQSYVQLRTLILAVLNLRILLKIKVSAVLSLRYSNECECL